MRVHLFTCTKVSRGHRGPLSNLSCITSAWLKTFIDAESPSVLSQSGATWTI